MNHSQSAHIPTTRTKAPADRLASRVPPSVEAVAPWSRQPALRLQRSAGNQAVLQILRRSAMIPPADAHHVPPSVRAALAGGGHPLGTADREFLEPRFGRDLGHVRIHSDAAAAESARSVGADAYTVGRDIVFAAGQHRPDTARGRRLLAHELAHTIQQGAGPATGAVSPATAIRMGDPRDAHEAGADRMAEQVVCSTQPVPAPAASTATHVADLTLQRQQSTVSGAAAPGLARWALAPPFLGQRPATELSDEELNNEIHILSDWLESVQESSPETQAVRERLAELQLVAARRRLAATQARLSKERIEHDVRLLRERSPGLLHMMLPAHTRYTYRDPSRELLTPALRPYALATTEASFAAARLGRDVLGVTAAVSGALMILNAFGAVALTEGGGAAALAAGAGRLVAVAGNELALASGALRAAATAGWSFYLANTIAVNEIGLFAVGLLISSEGDVPGLLKAMEANPLVAAQILAQAWILHVSIKVANGPPRPYTVRARMQSLEQQTDPRRLRLEVIDAPRLEAEEAITAGGVGQPAPLEEAAAPVPRAATPVPRAAAPQAPVRQPPSGLPLGPTLQPPGPGTTGVTQAAQPGRLLVDIQGGPAVRSETGQPTFLPSLVAATPGSRGVLVESADYLIWEPGITVTNPRDLALARILAQNLPRWPSAQPGVPAPQPAPWEWQPSLAFPTRGPVRVLTTQGAPGTTPVPQAFFPPVGRDVAPGVPRLVPLPFGGQTAQQVVSRLQLSTHTQLHGQVDAAYWRRPFALSSADPATAAAAGREIGRWLKPGGFLEMRLLRGGDEAQARIIAAQIPDSRVVTVSRGAIQAYRQSGQRPQSLSEEQWSILQEAGPDIHKVFGEIGTGTFVRIVRIFRGGSVPR